MKMRMIWTVAVVVLFEATAIAGEHTCFSKVVGLAREALMTQGRQAKAARARGMDLKHWGTLTAFVATDGTDTHTLLQRYGCRQLAGWGCQAIASIPLERLEALAADVAVKRIEAGPRSVLTMDTTRQVTHAMPAYETTTTHAAYTGKDVVIGVMDVGFDMSHPTFYDTRGEQFRIGAFWDQLSPDTVDSQMPVGRDYVGYEAVAACGQATDAPTEHHGNHTAGIAAGSGYGSPYRGMAYESDLCLVNNAVSADTIYIAPEDYYKYTTATDALGFKYIFDYADSKGKPCVVSFSEGYHPYLDSEDSLYAAFLDSLTTIPGHILVSSAGNDGGAANYMPKRPEQAAAGAFLNSWHKEAICTVKSGDRISLRLRTYNPQTGEVAQNLLVDGGDARLDSLLTDTLVMGSDSLEVLMTRYGSSFQNGDTLFLIGLVAQKNISELWPTALIIEGEGAEAEAFGGSALIFTTNAIDHNWNNGSFGHNVMAPSCFAGVISVGSTSHRPWVINQKGEPKSVGNGAKEGIRSYFSAFGPAMSGLMKPEVMAPGSNIVSAYSRRYEEEHPGEEAAYVTAYTNFRDGQHGWIINSGTSMSCPVVAGAIALWLQANPRLTQKEVKEVMSRTCRQPIGGMTYPNNEYGYGEIDVYRGLMDVLGLDAIDGLSTDHLAGVHISRKNGMLTLRTDTPAPTALAVRLYDLKGMCIARATMEAGAQILTIPTNHVLQGVYAVQIDAGQGCPGGSQLVRL